MIEGDFVKRVNEDDTISVLRILKIEHFPDSPEYGDTYHCLLYKPVNELPLSEDLSDLEVFVYHVPMSKEAVQSEGIVIGNEPITEDILIGFYEYLKQTDFPRYLEETGLDFDRIKADAQKHYVRAYELGEQKQFEESIKEYTSAINIFPFFYQAIDNRGFTYMDMGDFRSAISDFELSYSVFPESHIAFFSKGECHLKLGELEEAEQIFQDCLSKWPEHQAFFWEYLEIAKQKKRLPLLRKFLAKIKKI